MSYKQVWGLSQANETHPCSLCFPAHMLLKYESPLWLLGFRLTPFVLANQSPWCPASCFKTLFSYSVRVWGITEGLTKENSNNIGNVTLPFLPPLHIFQHYRSCSGRPLLVAIPFAVMFTLQCTEVSILLCGCASQIDSNLLFREEFWFLI